MPVPKVESLHYLLVEWVLSWDAADASFPFVERRFGILYTPLKKSTLLASLLNKCSPLLLSNLAWEVFLSLIRLLPVRNHSHTHVRPRPSVIRLVILKRTA